MRPIATIPIDYAAARPRGWSGRVFLGIAIVVLGMLLPCLVRVPGMIYHGPDWLMPYFGERVGAFLFFGTFNAVIGGLVLLGTWTCRSEFAVIVAAGVGFALPAYAHATANFKSDPWVGLVLVMVQIISLPLACAGCLLGLGVDRLLQRRKNSAA